MSRVTRVLFVMLPFYLFVFSLKFILFTEVLAVCPICTIAVGAGLGVSRALGIDDVVTSLWIGGLVLSMTFWSFDWLKKKSEKLRNINTYTLFFVLLVIMYLLVLIPLRTSGIIGLSHNRLWGFDKVLLGTIIGSIIFTLAVWADKLVRKVRGKQLFIYQRVVFPFVSLLVTSLVFYFVTR